MAEALILDAEALSAIAHATQRSVLALRARVVLRVAEEERAVVRVPAPVLAEVCRGGARDSAVDRVLTGHGIEVVPLSASAGRRAGSLLQRAGMSSQHAIDAFVVATALQYESAVIATHDPDDIARLAIGLRTVRVLYV